MWASLAAMCLGLFLLLVAVLLWWNFRCILDGKASDDSLGSTFLTVSRRVTNENMGKPAQTLFSSEDIEALRHAPQVEDVGIVRSLRPQAYMRLQLAPAMGFSTVMVLESVPDRFIDNRPADWGWRPGNRRLPVILSSSFLSLYNYAFAPSQGLPQLSEESIKVLPFTIEVGEGAGEQSYVGHIAGFSDRITSVLAPESFIQYANAEAGGAEEISRLVIKVKDASAAEFAEFLSSHGYITNSELMRWSRLRGIVDVVALVVGTLALLLLGMSVLVFVLFIELSIARARPSVILLREIGYSPSMLKVVLVARFVPLLSIGVAVSTVMGMAVQLSASYWGNKAGLHLGGLPGWPFWVCVAIICALLFAQVRRAVGRALRKA
jgi:hypothetical protein